MIKDLEKAYIENIENKKLYFDYEILFKVNNTLYNFDIRLKDFNQGNDCMISNFGYNFYCRPEKATKCNMSHYKTFKSFENAIIKTLKKHFNKELVFIGWNLRKN